MSTATNLDEIRRKALDRVDQAQKRLRAAIVVMVTVEALLLTVVLYLMDFSDRLHLLVFFCAMLVYLTVLAALLALGAFVGKVEARILRAVEAGG